MDFILIKGAIKWNIIPFNADVRGVTVTGFNYFGVIKQTVREIEFRMGDFGSVQLVLRIIWKECIESKNSSMYIYAWI